MVFAFKSTTVTPLQRRSKQSLRKSMAYGPNGMHASQPRHANTQKALRLYEDTQTIKGPSFGAASPEENIVHVKATSIFG